MILYIKLSIITILKKHILHLVQAIVLVLFNQLISIFYLQVDIISGTKKPQEEEAKKRKSRFDQGGPSTNILKPMVAPPTLTSVPSGTKATIDAFGGLKKTK